MSVFYTYPTWRWTPGSSVYIENTIDHYRGRGVNALVLRQPAAQGRILEGVMPEAMAEAWFQEFAAGNTWTINPLARQVSPLADQP